MRCVLCKSWLPGLVLIIAGLLAGCTGRVVFEPQPAWYSNGSGLYPTSRGRVFYGIGVATGAGSATLLRATADNRARQEMARILERYLSALFRKSTQMAAYSIPEQEQLAGRLLQRALARAVISDHRSQAAPKRLLALCEMQMDVFKQILLEDGALDTPLRQELLSIAEAVHTPLSE